MKELLGWVATDWLSVFMRLLPRGRIWARPGDTTSVQGQALLPLMNTPQRLGANAAYLLVDAFPATTDELLPEWQATLGLPDPCAGTSPTLAQEQAQVVARLTARGGNQSTGYFIRFAANLGYAITITQFTPFCAGRGRVGQPLCGAAWAYAWQVNAPQVTVTYFRAGGASVGQPLVAFGNTVLQCELNRLKPAHTVILYNFGAN